MYFNAYQSSKADICARLCTFRWCICDQGNHSIKGGVLTWLVTKKDKIAAVQITGKLNTHLDSVWAAI